MAVGRNAGRYGTILKFVQGKTMFSQVPLEQAGGRPGGRAERARGHAGISKETASWRKSKC
jgi:hypothetical protein